MNHKVSLGEKIAFALGDVGCNFIWTVVGSFLTLYYTDSVGISAAVVGTIMLITRILDGISDLGMGVVIDHTHTRWGKARPWVLITAPLMGIGLILTFSVPNWLSENGKIAYAVVTYILLAVIIFTACNLAYSTLTALITGRQDDRTSMTSIRYILVYAVMILISYTTMPLVEDFGWTGMSVIFGIAGMICLLITFFGTRERNIENKKNTDDNISIAKSFILLLKNKYFIVITILFVVNFINMGLTGGVGIYFARDFLGNSDLYGTMTLANYIPVMIGLFAFPGLAGKFGKWKCMLVGYILEAAGYLIILLEPTSFPMVLLGLAVRGIGHIPNSAGIYAMVADVADYGEWKNGIRNEGLTFSATSFGTKIGTGIGSAVVGWGLALGNYVGGATVQSASALESIKALYTYIPLAVTLVGIIAILNGNIDKIYPTIEKDLLERRKSKE